MIHEERLHFNPEYKNNRDKLRELLDGDLVFCAETFSNEGLIQLLNYIPRNTGTALPSTLYLGVFTTTTTPTLTATTVPAVGTTIASPGTAVGEPTIGTGGYARVSVANTAWAAAAVQGSAGQRSTASQQSFPQSTAAWSNTTVVGYFVATVSTAGSGLAYYYANFDDATSVAVNAANIVLQITPYWEFDY